MNSQFRRRGRLLRRVAYPGMWLQDIPTAIDLSQEPEGMDLPKFPLHALKGHWAVRVSGNWRVTFRFEDGAAADVNYLDHH